MTKDDDDLKTVSEAMEEWETQLPMNHGGRTLLKALSDLESDELDHRTLEGAEEAERQVFDCLLTLGTTADGRLRYFIYPAANTTEELRIRDVLLDALAARPERSATADEALAAVPEPLTTLVFAYCSTLDDGTRRIGIAWQRDQTFAQAVGHLKLLVQFIREQEDEAAKGGS
ncbi:MAG: hypothetical protein QY323_06035 [Patescibacteria group bacterium]|nr:MAG: hypothetical protein QY323_06035 [Patescibacteria group bacterium]